MTNVFILYTKYNISVMFTFAERLTRFHPVVSTFVGRKKRAEVQRRQLVAPDVYHRFQRY